ncbi:MAG: hypothetical protein WCS07_08900, partial [Sphaerochaeta sp.]
MASTVRLYIDVQAHLDGIKQTSEGLKSLGVEGQKLNQVLGGKNLDAMKIAMMDTYHSTALAKGEISAATQYTNNFKKALQSMKETISSGGSLLYTDGSGVQRETTKMSEAYGTFLDDLKYVEGETAGIQERIRANLETGVGFNEEKFNKGLESSAGFARMFGTEIDAVKVKMSSLQNEAQKLYGVKGQEDNVRKLSAEYQKQAKVLDTLQKQTTGAGTRIKNLIWNFVSAQAIVWGLRMAFSGLINIIRESSQAAAEAEQVYQKFLTVFNNMQMATDSVSKLVNEFGLANSSARDIMSTIGDMAAGLGATDAEAAKFAGTTAEFIQDLIAFKDVGGDVVEISKAFMSGAAGNTRNFRQWGSIVKEANVQAALHAKGLDRLTGSELEWAKAQERVAIVMEQQKNAMGATEREWDMMLSVQRRYTEQTKQMKENIGRTINEAWLPLKRVLLDVVEGWNKAYEAEQNYLNKTDAPSSLFNLETEDGRKDAKDSLQQFFSKREGNTTAMGVTYGIDAVDIEAAARAYGITAKEVAELTINNFKNNRALAEQVSLIDQKIAKEKEDNKALEDKKLGLQAYYETLQGVIDQFSTITNTTSIHASFLGEGTEKWINAIYTKSTLDDMGSQFKRMPSSDFADALDVALGLGDEKGLEKKKSKVKEAFEIINNALIKAVADGDTAMEKTYGGVRDTLVSMYQDVESEIANVSYDKQIADLEKSNELLKGNLLLEKQFGDEGSEWLALENARLEAIRKANDEYAERAKNPEDEASALADQERMIELINEQYGINLELLGLKLSREEGITAEKEKQALIDQRASAIDQGNQTLSDIRRSNAMYGMSDSERAKAEITNAVEDYAAILIRNGVEFDDVLGMSAQYRMEKEIEAENEYQEALKEARDTSLERMASLWDGFGDVGMVRGWVDQYKSDKDLGLNAGANLGWEMLAEFMTHIEAVNQILGIISIAFEELGPIVNDFLQPFIPIIKIIVSQLNMFVPILTMLFPIIKTVAVAFTWVSTVVSWVAKVIEYAAGKITFWTKSDDISWSEVDAVWSRGVETTEEIWAMEINARAEYVSALTDAQKGELDAYNEMFKAGLLTLTEYT